MRLLYLTPTAAMGGAERVLLDLLGMVRRAEPSWHLGLIVGNDGPLVEDAATLGVETTVLPFPRDFARLGDSGLGRPRHRAVRSRGPLGPPDQADFDGGPSIDLSRPAVVVAGGAGGWARFARRALGGSLGTIRYVNQLRRTIAAFRPDVVHSNGIKMHLLGSLAKPAGSALLWHFHDYPSARPVTNRLIKALKQRCDGVIAVSESVATDLRQELGPSVPVHAVWNSVDLTRFTSDGPRLNLDALAGLPPAEPGMMRIGLVATFARWKGHALFLEMLARLHRTHRFRAYIVGGPLYETHDSQVSTEELRTTIDRLGLSRVVGLTGFAKDAAAALRALDIVVHASTAPEPFGLVIAEAMATGRAVVISDSGGVAELVSHEQSGLTYRSGDVEQMTRQVARLLDDPALKAGLGLAAGAVATQQFNQQRMTAQMLELYGRLNRAAAA